ncbi:MAG: MBOAT family O-acyltransferase [Bacteroidia bacterium]
MLFSSTLFLIYFLPVFFTIYFLLPVKLKNYFIVLASIFFYAWGAPVFLFTLLGTIIFNFGVAHILVELPARKVKKRLLAFSIISNLSFLLYYKYANFFVENVNELLLKFDIAPMEIMNIALPIGISFFTFHQLSFIIDVYRGVKPPMKKISDYALYILIFPQLIAGPIIRYNEISDQIEGRDKRFNVDEVLLGFLRFAIGLAKKVLIANVLGKEADRIFALQNEELDFGLAWMGAITYTFQIYFDFSGYSDMALGLAKMMGFTFPENFNYPYIAQSITDFWRRWHISLSRWMRDYLYIPLGGNKVSNLRLYFNLWVVFLISGFWHGAEWTFILWGAYHGFFLAIDRLFFLKATERIGKIPRVILTFIIAVFGWVLFRAKDVAQAGNFMGKMLSFDNSKDAFYSTHLIAILFLAGIISFLPLFLKPRQEGALFKQPNVSVLRYTVSVILIFISLLLCVGEITSSDFNPFIYFRF